MKQVLVSLIILFSCITKLSFGNTVIVSDTLKSTQKELKLFWSEEFDKSGAPDTTKWMYNIGNGPDGWGNQELEYYTDRIQNAYVEKGRGKKEKEEERGKKKKDEEYDESVRIFLSV